MNQIIDYLLQQFQNAENMDDFRINFAVSLMLFMGLFLHSFFFIYYIILGIDIMFCLNVFSVAIYLTALNLNRARKRFAAAMMGILEVTAYSTIATVLMGRGINNHWFMLIVIVLIYLILDYSRSQKLALSLLIAAALNFCAVSEYFIKPPYPQDGNYILAIINVNAVLVCVLLELGMSAIFTRVMTVLQSRDVEKFKDLCYIDPLTRLHNRRYASLFFDRLSGGALPYSYYFFVMLDIDDFKKINDEYGHETGDVILLHLANVLRENIRQTDLVCRWGGEEFLIVMCGCTVSAGTEIMEDVRKIIEESVYRCDKGAVTYTITCGASPLINNSIHETIDECDKKLYEGKRSGKNKVVA